jgi:hypothetical protein
LNARRSPVSLRAVTEPGPRSGITRSLGERTLVVIVDRNRLRKADLARALVQARCDVASVDSPAELPDALGDGSSLRGVIVDSEHPEATGVLAAIASSHATLPVIVRGNVGRAKALGASGLTRLEVVPQDSTLRDLLEALATGTDEPA